MVMSIKDNHSRRVTFDTGDELGGKINKLTVMIGKLTARDNRSGRQFKSSDSTKAKQEDKIEVTMIDTVMISEVVKIDIGQIVEMRRQYRQDRGRPKYKQNYRGGNFRGKARMYQNFERQNNKGEYRNNYRDEGYRRSRDRNRSRERSFSRNIQ